MVRMLEDIEHVAKVACSVTKNRTSKISKEMKLKYMINDNQDVIDELFYEIGKDVFDSYHLEKSKDDNYDSVINDLQNNIKRNCQEIDAYNEEIRNINIELLQLNKLKICRNCFNEINIDSNYCQNCGANQRKIKNNN